MRRTLPIESLLTLARAVAPLAESLSGVDPRRLIIRRYLWAVSKAAKLQERSARNKARGHDKIAARQASRAAAEVREALELRPLVEAALAESGKCVEPKTAEVVEAAVDVADAAVNFAGEFGDGE